jgi:hypothetical protein
MARYYFHVYALGKLILPDLIGVELPGTAFAREECSRIIRELIEDDEWRDAAETEHEFRVVDQLGQVVLTVPFV